MFPTAASLDEPGMFQIQSGVGVGVSAGTGRLDPASVTFTGLIVAVFLTGGIVSARSTASGACSTVALSQPLSSKFAPIHPGFSSRASKDSTAGVLEVVGPVVTFHEPSLTIVSVVPLRYHTLSSSFSFGWFGCHGS